MKNYLEKPIFDINNKLYLSLLIFLVAPLNFISGITIDMYAPSMPALATYYSASIAAIQNTITTVVFGMALGGVVFGALIDVFGRKRILLFGLVGYTVASLIVFCTHTIFAMLLIRFIQGMMIAGVTIGCRAIIIDNIEVLGHRYPIAILYTSIAYGVGPIVGPFIGGILQYHFNWQANFIVFALFSAILALLIILFLRESIVEKQTLSLISIAKNYLMVIKHRRFVAIVFIMGLMQIELMIYPTIAPFIVDNILHLTALHYGNTALIVGGSYLYGALVNRFLLKKFLPGSICIWGFYLMTFATMLAFVFAFMFKLNLITLMLPIIIIGIGVGLAFPNLISANLKLFPKNAGIAMAVQLCAVTVVAAVGVFIMSLFNINSLGKLACVYIVIIVLQLLIFCKMYRKQLN